MATRAKRDLTKPVAAIAVPGWPSGSPSFESRADLTQGKKTGVAGRPGIYDEMYQQFPPFRRQVDRLRSRLAAITVETVKCGSTKEATQGTENPEEAAFFDAVDAMLFGGRLRVENGDGYSEGFGEYCAWCGEAPPYGFVLGDPWISDLTAPDDPNPSLATATITVSPMQRAAVTNWGLYEGGVNRRRPTVITYREAIGVPKTIQYADLLHIQHGGGPGQPAGQALARPLVSLFMAWRDSLINAYYTELVSRGVPVMEMPSPTDVENFNAFVETMEKWAEGNLKWVGMPNGTKGGLTFPSGSPPDYIATRTKLESAVAEVFDDGLTLLGMKAWGSRAAAETTQGDDAKNERALLDSFVNRCYRKLVEWIAAQVGFKLTRCRTARTVGEATVDVATLTASLVAAKGAGLLANWTAKDEDAWRAVAGIQSLEAAGIKQGVTEATAPLAVGSLQASVQILSALNPTDPNVAPIAPEAALELLVGAGIPGDAAKRMIDAQTKAGAVRAAETQLAPAAPVAPAPRRAPILGATLREHSDDEEHPAGCGCRRHGARLEESGEAEPVSFTTRGGRSWQSYRRPFIVEIDGRSYTPELGVAWADDADKRSAIDASMVGAIGEVAGKHRADAVETYGRVGYSKPESDRLFEKWQPQYANAIEAYAREVATVANGSRREELAAQVADASPTSRTGLPTDTARQILEAVESRVQAQIDNAADILASRVQSQVDRGFIGGGVTGALAAIEQQTVNGLARDVRPIGNVVESTSAIESATAPGDGFVVIAAIRSTMADEDVCDWCRSQDKLTFRFPEDTDRFLAYVEAHGPPDQQCEGGDECRCRYVTVLGREGKAS